MSHKNRLAVITLLMILSATVAWAAPEDRQKPITGRADSNIIDVNTGNSVLTGHVTIMQGSLTIQADTVSIQVDITSNRLTYMIATGLPVVLTDTPKENSGVITLTGRQIEFFPDENRVVSLGEATLGHDKNQAKGERIEYNLLTGTTQIDSDRTINSRPDGNQAVFIIQPGATE